MSERAGSGVRATILIAAAHQHFVDGVGGMLLNGQHPLVDVRKRPLVRHIVYEQNPHRAAVVCRRDSLEALLPGGVPYLQLDPLAIESDGTDLEVDTASRARGSERLTACQSQMWLCAAACSGSDSCAARPLTQ